MKIEGCALRFNRDVDGVSVTGGREEAEEAGSESVPAVMILFLAWADFDFFQRL
jgi:hypothetical protein